MAGRKIYGIIDMQGVIFDIKEFAIFDGPGIRHTIFLKGCPLHCQWCHNPEGINNDPELMVSMGCTECGKCTKVCGNQICLSCGKCIAICPQRLRKICGERISAVELSRRMQKLRIPIEGYGVTLSGGEPMFQPDFSAELLICLKAHGINTAVETSGYASAAVFKKIVDLCDYVMIDLKHFNNTIHRKYTGVSNKRILANIRSLDQSGKPYTVRIPLISGITDTETNMEQSAEFLSEFSNLECVELLSYNVAAGAKYDMLRRENKPAFTPSDKEELISLIFSRNGIRSRFL